MLTYTHWSGNAPQFSSEKNLGSSENYFWFGPWFTPPSVCEKTRGIHVEISTIPAYGRGSLVAPNIINHAQIFHIPILSHG